MRVLVTGAGGFVGSFLAEGFIAAGHAVVALDRAFDLPVRARLSGATIVEATINAETLGRLEPVELVVHGAAVTTAPSVLGLSEIEHIRLHCNALLDVLSYARECGARDFVSLSSSAVFDTVDGIDLLLESTPANATSAYSLAKRACEILVETLENDSIRALSVRLGPVYGPGERSRQSRQNVSLVRRWADAASAGEPIVVGSPDSRRDWTYGPDLPGAMLALLARQPAVAGILHLTAGEAVSDAELGACMATLCGVSCHIQQERGASRRLPMSSERITPRELYDWTPLELGLAKILEEQQ